MRDWWDRFKRLYIERLLYILVGVYYSLPIQLLVNQIRSHFTLPFYWVFLSLVVSQRLLKDMGGPYLLLEPEYRNIFGFEAMFLLGVSFGVFSLAYQITIYILDGHRFPFIGLEEKPFLKFSLNNSLLPSAFWVSYIYFFIDFQKKNPALSELDIFILLIGFISGGAFISVISYYYFTHTELDLFKLLSDTLSIGGDRKTPKVILREARRTIATNIRVDYFLKYAYKISPVPKKSRANFRNVVQIMNRNHNNALKIEVSILITLIILGLFRENEYFQIPAGASFILLLSFVIMLMGALSFWFRRMGPLTVFLLIGVFYVINNLQPFIGKNYMYGVNYAVRPAEYSVENFRKLATAATVRADSLHGIKILENWKSRLTEKYGINHKPKITILCVTGGGTRSATWTVNCLQNLEKATDGRFMESLHLITGASGGMMGAAYFRELLFQKTQGKKVDLLSEDKVDAIAKDILNPIIFNFVSTLFLPSGTFQYGKYEYDRDRGYAFEQQLIRNTRAFYDRKLSDYAAAEENAQTPLIILSPVVINDARKLYISSQPISYLCRPQKFNDAYENEFSGVEFRRLFGAMEADSLRYVSAIRLNATFPTILPFVELPTRPSVQAMDAGLLDNFGVTVAVKYLFYFSEWIEKNTDGVVLIQVRDSKRESPIPQSYKTTLLSKLSGVGNTYGAMAEGKDFLYDDLLAYAKDRFGTKFQTYELQYIPTSTFREASLSLHLTRREKEDILSAIENPENVRTMLDLQKKLQINKYIIDERKNKANPNRTKS